MSEHLASGFLVVLLSAVVAMVKGRRWFEMASLRMISTVELLAGLLLAAACLAWVGRLWGTPWGYPLLAVFATALWAQERLRRHVAFLRRTRWMENDLQCCQRLLEADPQNHGAREEMARLYEAAGDYDRAIDAIQEALELVSDYPSYRYTLQRLLGKKEGSLHCCPRCGRLLTSPMRRCPTCGRRQPQIAGE